MKKRIFLNQRPFFFSFSKLLYKNAIFKLKVQLFKKVDSQTFCGTFFALKMTPVEGRNVDIMFLICLADIFGIKLSLFSELYRVFQLQNRATTVKFLYVIEE